MSVEFEELAKLRENPAEDLASKFQNRTSIFSVTVICIFSMLSIINFFQTW